MSRKLLRILFAPMVAACALVPLTAVAGSLTYAETFMASGTVNGTPFSGNVIFSFTSDSNMIIQDGDLFQTPNGVASFFIQGVGAGTFNDPFYVFDNQGNAVAGFSDANIEDIVDLSNTAFFTYDLKSPIGPLNSTFFFTDNGAPLGSNLGTVIF